MKYQLAQVNIAEFKLPKDDPANADFINSLDEVNAIAEQQPGFIWRLVGEGNDALDLDPFGNPNIALNMSVWADIQSLVKFVYRNDAHKAIMRRRKEWFHKMEVYMVLWWVEAGRLPTADEAKLRLELLRQNGPTYSAFTFKQPFAAPSTESVNPFQDECA